MCPEGVDDTVSVGVVGVGYVGLTTAACLAHLGHRVHAVDVDETKIADLSRGEVALAEPGLGDLVRDQVALGRLVFGTEIGALAERDVVFVCVPTPMGAAGVADLRVVYGVTAAVVATLRPGAILVNKSTTPVGTAARLAEMVSDAGIDVVSNPEFLRESHRWKISSRPTGSSSGLTTAGPAIGSRTCSAPSTHRCTGSIARARNWRSTQAMLFLR